MSTLSDILTIIAAIDEYMPMVQKLMPEFGKLVQKLMDTVTDADIIGMQIDDDSAAIKQQRAIDERKLRE